MVKQKIHVRSVKRDDRNGLIPRTCHFYSLDDRRIVSPRHPDPRIPQPFRTAFIVFCGTDPVEPFKNSQPRQKDGGSGPDTIPAGRNDQTVCGEMAVTAKEGRMLIFPHSVRLQQAEQKIHPRFLTALECPIDPPETRIGIRSKHSRQQE